MSTQDNTSNENILKAVSIFTESINNTRLSGINDLFSSIVNNSEVDISNWEIKDFDKFLNDIDPISKCQDDVETEEEDSLVTKKYIPNLFISLIAVLQEIQSNDIDNQIYNLVTKYIQGKTEGHIERMINYIMPSNKRDLLNEKSTAIVTILISSLKSLLNPNDKDMKELLQNIFQHVNQIEIDEENDKTNNSEYLNFMLSLFSELFGDLELEKVIKLIWEVTSGNTEQIAEYISYLLYEHQVNNQKEEEEEEGVESKHFGLATKIVIEKYIEPSQQKQRRQLIRNRNKASNEVASANSTQTEEEAANADLNEIYTFIKQVLHHTCLDDDQNGYPKELALFFSSFKDFWEPDSIIKFIMSDETNGKNIEENYKEYYGPFLMDLADLMDWTNKQCESVLIILTKGWTKSNRIAIAKMLGLSLNDIKRLYSDCKDLSYNDPDYASEADSSNQDKKDKPNEDISKTKKPVVLSIRGSDFKRTFTKPLSEKDNVSNTICRFYGTPRGCSAGKHCPYRHIQTTRSSYISRRLNHSMYSKSSYGSRFGNSNSRYPRNSNINSGIKHRSSYQNMNNYRGNSTRNPSMIMNNNDIGKGRMSSRMSTFTSNDPMMKYGKKGDRDLHDKSDFYGKKEIPMNHKLRKHASFINPPSYRSQTSKEYKPIEAMDPAMSHHGHSNIICYFYNDPKGCSNGANCKFLHIKDSRNYDSTGRNSHSYNSSYKPFISGSNGYSGSHNLPEGNKANRKPSKHNISSKSSKVNNEDNPTANPTSITIVNSSQTNNTTTSLINKEENTKEFNSISKTSTPVNFNGTKSYSQTPCAFFSKEGSCKYGEKCKFLHIS